MQPIGAHGGKVIYFGSFYLRGELCFLNCDNIGRCVVNRQFELLEFVFNSIYGDLTYNEISLTFTVVVCVVMWLSLVYLVRLAWYHMRWVR